MKTHENLKAAFAGESQANRKYLAYAKKAEQDGYPNVARLFRAVAAAETVHAHSHLKVAGGINDTRQNLQDAMGGENYEIITMYPEFIADAEAEGEKIALRSFTWAWEVEKIHEQLYKQALKAIDAGDIEANDYWVCGTCGHTHIGPEAPEECPICGAKRKFYTKID